MPVGLSGSVSTSTPGRAPMPAASASAARSCAGSGTPPASAPIGTPITRLPAIAAWAA